MPMTNPFDFFKKINADKIKEALGRAQADLAALRIQGEAGAGMVKVILNGQKHVLKVEIDESIYTEGKSIVEELTAAAMQDALTKSERLIQETMAKTMGNLGLPSNLNFPFDNSSGG